MTQERTNKQARLTAQAYDGWEQTCRRHHVRFTPLMEILGLLLAEGDDSWIPDHVWRQAQELDYERGSRRHPPRPS